MNLKEQITSIARNAQISSRMMLGISSATKNKVLREMSLALMRGKKRIIQANKKDLRDAIKNRMSAAFVSA